MEAYDRAIALKSDHVEAHAHRASALMALKLPTAALEEFGRVVALTPGSAEAHLKRGIALQELGRRKEAIACYAHALTLRPDCAEGHLQWGFTLSSLRRYEEALEHFERAISINPELVEAQVHPSLVGLLRGLEGVAGVFPHGSELPEFDYHCPDMSMPLALKTTLDTIPCAAGYLRADPARVTAWREQLGERRRPRIGLVWSGNPQQYNDRHRSVRLAQWVEHLPQDFDYVCMQKDIRLEDRATLAANRWITVYEKGVSSFEEAAAL